MPPTNTPSAPGSLLPPGTPLPPGIVAAPIRSATWINADQPIEWDSLRGKVVLVEFWTYGCVNCQNVIAPLREMYADYKDRGFTIIAVHSPEFSYEKDAEAVRKAVRQRGIQYPVALDNDFAIWKSYFNLYWPAFYLVDQQGFVRYRRVGEGGYDKTRAWIEYLLAEGG